MQRDEDGGVVISCDFCGTDWDQVRPMIEGHHGSVLCLECLKLALEGMKPSGSLFRCTLCLRDDLPAGTLRWISETRPEATACCDCVRQAARGFDRDPDVDWVWKK